MTQFTRSKTIGSIWSPFCFRSATDVAKINYYKQQQRHSQIHGGSQCNHVTNVRFKTVSSSTIWGGRGEPRDRWYTDQSKKDNMTRSAAAGADRYRQHFKNGKFKTDIININVWNLIVLLLRCSVTYWTVSVCYALNVLLMVYTQHDTVNK